MTNIFSTFPDTSPKHNLPDLMVRLYEQQYHSWELMRNNYDALHKVNSRQINCGGNDVTIQWNPARVTSTTAKVSQQAIAARPCFLCEKNLPDEQKGIQYDHSLFILCNPYPIFPYHYTLSGVEHTEQVFLPSLGLMLDLVAELDSRFTVFYNGPQCGASAPDHFHFQAIPSGKLPIEKLSKMPRHREIIFKQRDLALIFICNIGRACFLIEGTNRVAIKKCMATIIGKLQLLFQVDQEPMINVVGTYTKGTWRMYLFPRSVHRPSQYFAEGEENRVISPASIDMSGFVITPFEKDFKSINTKDIENIFEQVSISQSQIKQIIQWMKKHD